jgi:hypothetical protein
VRPSAMFVALGVFFSVFAALAAFLITYGEWSHHYSARREPFKLALRAAVVAFLVFGALTLVASLCIGPMTQR